MQGIQRTAYAVFIQVLRLNTGTGQHLHILFLKEAMDMVEGLSVTQVIDDQRF